VKVSRKRGSGATRPFGCSAAAAAGALLLALGFSTSAAGPASAQEALSDFDYRNVQEVVVATGKSEVIQLPQSYSDLLIADPTIADVLPLNSRSVYVVGKKTGSTALTIYGPGKRLIAAVNVVVSADIEGLKRRLHEILPDEKGVAIRAANDSIVLSGTASSPVVLDQILTLADTYAPKKVVNMLTVEGVQQVMLSVRFVEMERTTAKNLRLNVQGNTRIDPVTGDSKIFFQTGDNFVGASGAVLDSIGSVLGVWHEGSGDLSILFDALETKGLVKTLAEPTLVAMSGDTASFLAGGEFPIPVSASTGGDSSTPTITVEFKQFGVALGFTPTILKDGLINLVVNPEVSAIDPSISVQTGLIRVPGLKVRRAHTTIELRDGESFTIAGLLKEDYSNNVRQLPWIGDIPVLGTLFRSTGYQRGETELVIVVTPHLATPRRGLAASPADRFLPPSDLELFLFGSMKGSASSLRPEDRALISVDPRQGGIEGPHGHVLY
jgi:pilus assembly protein CpaC